MAEWLDGDQDRGVPLLVPTVMSYVEEGESEADLLAGISALAGILLVRLEAAEGIPADEILRDIGARYSPPAIDPH